MMVYTMLGLFAMQDLKNLSPDELFNMQLKRLEKEKQDQANQLKKQEKKVCLPVCVCVQCVSVHACV